MCIALHPYWVGQPHRIRAFQRALEYVLSHPGVWLTTAGEITDWFNANHLPLIEVTPGSAGGRQWLSRQYPAGGRGSAAPAWTTCTAFRTLPDAALRMAGRCPHRFTVTLVLDYWELIHRRTAAPTRASLAARQFSSRTG